MCNKENCKYGISPLPLLDSFYGIFIAYFIQLTFWKKRYAKGDDKNLKIKRKEMIKNNLRSKLSFIVDVVKQGSGTTNTGKVAHCFFCRSWICS